MTNVTGGLRVRVAKKTVEAVDICSFELVEDGGRPLPAFSAGSHVDVDVGNGLTRQYSLCNDPAESHRYQIAVLRDPATAELVLGLRRNVVRAVQAGALPDAAADGLMERLAAGPVLASFVVWTVTATHP